MANVNPSQLAPQLGPQPNFARLTQALQQIAAELGKLANLPPFAQGAVLLQQIQQMQQDIQTLSTDIHTNHQASEYNTIARLRNSVASGPNHPLTALHDYRTNTIIPGFPATPGQLATMTGLLVDSVLVALDLPTTGNVAARRQRLKFYIGLAEIP